MKTQKLKGIFLISFVILLEICQGKENNVNRNLNINIMDHLGFLKSTKMTSDLNLVPEITGKILKGRSQLSQEFYNQWDILQRDLSIGPCLTHLTILIQGLAANSLTSLKYFDSWAKIPSGLLKGHLMDLGNFDECVGLHKQISDDSYLNGKYCLTTLPLSSSGAIPFSLNLGICIPAVCSAEEFNTIFIKFLQLAFNVILSPNQTVIYEELCQVREKDPLSGVQWFAVSVIIILGTAMLLSSLYHYYCKWFNKSVNKLLVSFSIPMNLEFLLKITPNNKSSHVIPCLNGIRVLSIMWVMLGHGFLSYQLFPNINTLDVFSWARTPFSMLLQYGFFAVDTFFFLSGFLLATIAFRELKKNNGKLNIPMMYLHRFLRLTPMVALSILIYYAIYPIMTTGPIWPNFGNFFENCHSTWWSTLLYIHNYVNPQKMCVGHTWYLAIDMQLYILSPIFLYILWRWRKKGVVALVLLQLLLLACVFTTIEVDKISFHVDGISIASDEAMKKTYYPTHTRSAPWVIGFVFGYFLHTKKGRRIKMPKIVVLLGWLTSFALIAIILFAWYPQAQVTGSPITITEEAFYWTFGRVAWPMALCWIVFASVNGYGGVVDEFLSCPLWQPLAKLSFCMYIWHLFIECINAGGTRTDTYFSNYDMFLRFWADFGWTIMFSALMYLAFEAPLVNLEKLLLHKEKHPKIIEEPDHPHIDPIRAPED